MANPLKGLQESTVIHYSPLTGETHVEEDASQEDGVWRTDLFTALALAQAYSDMGYSASAVSARPEDLGEVTHLPFRGSAILTANPLKPISKRG